MSAVAHHICSEVNLPLCKALNIEPTLYGSRSGQILGLTIQAPFTLVLLIISIACAARIINHVNSLYASIGRGEMRTFFYLYIFSSSTMIITLIFGSKLNKHLFHHLVVLQNAVNSTMYFSIFVAGITIDRIYGIFGMRSASFMRLIVVLYLGLILSFTFLCYSTKNNAIIVLLYSLNSLFLVFYLVGQFRKLKKIKSDIWAYGVLGIIFLFFVCSIVHTAFGSLIVAKVTERHLDSLFFVLLYNLCVAIMIHKYWLNTCDFELECLALTV